MPQNKTNSAWRIFRWPIALALTTVVGLVSALMAEGWADVLSWLLLGALIVVIGVAWRRIP